MCCVVFCFPFCLIMVFQGYMFIFFLLYQQKHGRQVSLLLKRMKRRQNPVLPSIRSCGSAVHPRLYLPPAARTLAFHPRLPRLPSANAALSALPTPASLHPSTLPLPRRHTPPSSLSAAAPPPAGCRTSSRVAAGPLSSRQSSSARTSPRTYRSSSARASRPHPASFLRQHQPYPFHPTHLVGKIGSPRAAPPTDHSAPPKRPPVLRPPPCRVINSTPHSRWLTLGTHGLSCHAATPPTRGPSCSSMETRLVAWAAH
jgi:hypothetical protein